ncbi:MAG: hypothetical protein ACYTEL_05610 [Planctomycetota bacterium]|jgi:hypothetical protein
MKTQRITVLLASLILLAAAIAQPQEKAQPTTGARTASCLVKVTCDREILPLSLESIQNLLCSSGVGGKAAAEVLDVSPDESCGLFNIEPLTTRPPRPTARRARTRTTAPTPSARRVRPHASAEPDSQYDDFEDNERLQAELEALRGMMQDNTDVPKPKPAFRRRPTRGARTPSRTTTAASFANQTLLLQLQVELPENIKPAAEEFMNALINNLRSTLRQAWDTTHNQIGDHISWAEHQREKAQAQLESLLNQARAVETAATIGVDPADIAVLRQLEQTVDLSALRPEMSFYDAMDLLKNSVDPPLRIVVLWRNLLDDAEIDQTTAINMDPIPTAPLGMGLDLLLKSVAAGVADLDYIVDNGIITVATVDGLPRKLVTRVYELRGLVRSTGGARNLVRLIPQTIEPDSWYETGQGEGTITSHEGRKLIVLQTAPVHQKIQKLLDSAKADTAYKDTPRIDLSVDMLLDRKNDLLWKEQSLQMDVARLQARRAAIEEQIARTSEHVSAQMQTDPVAAELEPILDELTKQQNLYKELVEQDSTTAEVYRSGLIEVTEKIASTRLALAERRDALARSAGGDQLARFNSQLAELIVEQAEKEAELQVVSRQLAQNGERLAAAATFDPQASQIRLAKQALDAAEHRLGELNVRLANLAEPTVTVLGAD